MDTPYLIQRGKIKSPLAEEHTRLSNAVDFEYMGSSEFEWGALPQSFRRMQAYKDKWVMRKVPEIFEEGGPCLRVFSSLNDVEFEIYKGYLLRLRGVGEPMHLKESSHFDVASRARSKYIAETTFWWDITNDVMFGFSKPFMNRLQTHVEASLAYMDEQKKVAK
jgi:hypothetical protein